MKKERDGYSYWDSLDYLGIRPIPVPKYKGIKKVVLIGGVLVYKHIKKNKKLNKKDLKKLKRGIKNE